MKQMKILVVDDDRDFAESLAMVIESKSHQCQIAFSGTEAVDRFKEQEFDLAFMDVKLPGMNGVESLLEVRSFRPEAKIVMMTGYAVPQLLDRAVENGAWAVLRKPFDPAELLALIDRIKPDVLLIADDDPDFALSLKHILTEKGWTVFVAPDGRQAVARIRSDTIDILILDLRMPRLSGLDAFMEMRRSGHEVPTLIVTAYADEESASIDTMLAHSAKKVLRKPFHPATLIAAIEGLAKFSKEG